MRLRLIRSVEKPPQISEFRFREGRPVTGIMTPLPVVLFVARLLDRFRLADPDHW